MVIFSVPLESLAELIYDFSRETVRKTVEVNLDELLQSFQRCWQNSPKDSSTKYTRFTEPNIVSSLDWLRQLGDTVGVGLFGGV